MEKKSINKVELQGFLGKDAIIRTFESGHTLLTMSIATNESYKNTKEEWVTNTTWHNITYWQNKNNENVDFLKKGNLITVSGKLSTRKYTDKQGQNKYITEVIAQKLEQVKIA